MAVLSGVDEAGAPALYDIPDGELSKYKLNLKPQGVVPAGRATSEVEGYAAICWYYVEDGYGNWVYWEEYC